MKKIALTSLLAVFVAGAASAADMAPYASLKLGYNSAQKADIEYKGTKVSETPEMNGYTGSVAYGAAFTASDMVGIRGELEYAYASDEDSNDSSVKMSSNTLMLNGYADFGDSTWVVKPYVGLGVGYTFATAEEGTTSEKAAGLAYGASAGVAYAVDSNWIVDLGAKYMMNNLVYDSNSDVTMNVPTLSYMLGARYKF